MENYFLIFVIIILPMAKRTKEKELLSFYETEEGLHKINTIKSGLSNNTIKSFPQIFATISKSNLQILLGISFYSFIKKVEDPGKFSLNEIEFMAAFFGVEYDTMLKFVRSAMILSKNQRKSSVKKR